MNRRDLAILVVGVLLLGAGLVRVLLLDVSGTRQISVEAVTIPSAPIKSGQTLEQEAFWAPPDNVFIIGWSPHPGSPAAMPELHLLSGTTTIFSSRPTALQDLTPIFMPAGTGFRVNRGERVRLQLRLQNSGPDGETHGARALVYFHPVSWR